MENYEEFGFYIDGYWWLHVTDNKLFESNVNYISPYCARYLHNGIIIIFIPKKEYKILLTNIIILKRKLKLNKIYDKL
jgi:hypothetical protein